MPQPMLVIWRCASCVQGPLRVTDVPCLHHLRGSARAPILVALFTYLRYTDSVVTSESNAYKAIEEYGMTPSSATQFHSRTVATTLRPELLRLLDDLPQSKQAELLNFARFLRQQAAETPNQSTESLKLRSVPANSLAYLTGLVTLGGDALIDSEALYDGS